MPLFSHTVLPLLLPLVASRRSEKEDIHRGRHLSSANGDADGPPLVMADGRYTIQLYNSNGVFLNARKSGNYSVEVGSSTQNWFLSRYMEWPSPDSLYTIQQELTSRYMEVDSNDFVKTGDHLQKWKIKSWGANTVKIYHEAQGKYSYMTVGCKGNGNAWCVGTEGHRSNHQTWFIKANNPVVRVFDQPVFIISTWAPNTTPEFLEDRVGKVGVSTDQGAYQRWVIERSGDGDLVFIRNSYSGKYLEDRSGKVGVHKDKGGYQKWDIQWSGDGADGDLVLIKGHRGKYLENRKQKGKTGVRTHKDRGSYQKWRVTDLLGSTVCFDPRVR